jgi:hypothetical protein
MDAHEARLSDGAPALASKGGDPFGALTPCYLDQRMKQDPITGEVFLRVVGRRPRPPLGEPPSPEARAALATLVSYRTAAPKGIFIYRCHEDMDADRLRWTVQAIVEHGRRG